MRPVNPPGAAIPGISSAVRVTGGDVVFVSGHVPITPGGDIVGGGFKSQVERVFETLETTLAADGCTLADLVRLTYYVRNLEPAKLETVRAVRDRYVDTARPPASTLVGVAALYDPDVEIEIDAVAACPPGNGLP